MPKTRSSGTAEKMPERMSYEFAIELNQSQLSGTTVRPTVVEEWKTNKLRHTHTHTQTHKQKHKHKHTHKNNENEITPARTHTHTFSKNMTETSLLCSTSQIEKHQQ